MQWQEAGVIKHSPFNEDLKLLIVKFIICETNICPFKIPKSAVRCFQVLCYWFSLMMCWSHSWIFSSNAGGTWRRRGKKGDWSCSQTSLWIDFSRKEKSKRFDHSDCFSLVITLFARPVMSGFRGFGRLVTLHSCVFKWIKIKSLTWKGYFKTDCACGFESWCFEQRRDWFNGINA